MNNKGDNSNSIYRKTLYGENIQPVFKKVAKKIPKMTLAEYVEKYEPDNRGNECCFNCANFAGDCSWSKSFQPVEGWIALEGRENIGRYNADKPWYKILYCPEFKEDNPAVKRDYDGDGIMKLAEAVYKSAGEEYRSTLESLKAYEKMIRESRQGGEWLYHEMYKRSVSGYVKSYSDLIYQRTGIIKNVYESVERREGFKLNNRLTNFCLKWQSAKKY